MAQSKHPNDDPIRADVKRRQAECEAGLRDAIDELLSGRWQGDDQLAVMAEQTITNRTVGILSILGMGRFWAGLPDTPSRKAAAVQLLQQAISRVPTEGGRADEKAVLSHFWDIVREIRKSPAPEPSMYSVVHGGSIPVGPAKPAELDEPVAGIEGLEDLGMPDKMVEELKLYSHELKIACFMDILGLADNIREGESVRISAEFSQRLTNWGMGREWLSHVDEGEKRELAQTRLLKTIMQDVLSDELQEDAPRMHPNHIMEAFWQRLESMRTMRFDAFHTQMHAHNFPPDIAVKKSETACDDLLRTALDRLKAKDPVDRSDISQHIIPVRLVGHLGALGMSTYWGAITRPDELQRAQRLVTSMLKDSLDQSADVDAAIKDFFGKVAAIRQLGLAVGDGLYAEGATRTEATAEQSEEAAEAAQLQNEQLRAEALEYGRKAIVAECHDDMKAAVHAVRDGGSVEISHMFLFRLNQMGFAAHAHGVTVEDHKTSLQPLLEQLIRVSDEPGADIDTVIDRFWEKVQAMKIGTQHMGTAVPRDDQSPERS